MNFKKWLILALLIVAPVICFSASTDYRVTNNGEVYSYDLITKSPWVDVRSFMDGQSGRPTYATWYANQATTDVTTVLQAAIDTQSPIYLPEGMYYITDTLTSPVIAGLTVEYTGKIVGSGAANILNIRNGTVKKSTVIKVPAGFGKALFEMTGSRNLVFRDFSVIGAGKTDANSIAFHFNTLNASWELTNIVIYDWETGIQTGNSGGTQGNDAEGYHYNVNIDSCTYATRIYNSQSMNLNFFGSQFGAGTDYTCKVETVGAYSGSKIRLHGCWVGSKVCVWKVTGSWGMAYAQGCHFESGAGPTEDPTIIFDVGLGFSTSPNPIVLIGNEFNYYNSKYNTTVPFIQTGCPGPIYLAGNKIYHYNPIINTFGPVKFENNYWYYEPLIYRSDAPWVTPSYKAECEYYLYYNGFGGDSIAHAQSIQPDVRNGMSESYGTALPTTGTYMAGSKRWKTDAAGGGLPGWVCVTSGTYSAATDSTGDTDGSTGVITGMTDTSDFNVGDFVSVSAGFPVAIIKILRKTATSITVDWNSTSAESNITVATPDPVWKEMAILGA